jgi:signal peptidase I
MAQQKGERPALSDAAIDAVLNIWADAERQNIVPIEGVSMHPFLQHGDQALLKHGLRGLQTGDIIVFRQDNQLVAHRLLALRSDGSCLTKGDNVQFTDPVVTADQVVGRVLAVNRNGRVMRLDTLQWRVTGRLIGGTALFWVRFLVLGRRVKRRLIGRRSLRITGRLEQLLFKFSKLVLRVLRPIVCRWKNT